MCTVCNNVFHKSCLHRFKNQISFVKENKIICCSDSKDNSYNFDDEKSILEKTIDELTDDAALKTQYIKKLKIEHDIFIKDALKAEEEMNELLKNKDKFINQLTKQIELLNKKYMIDPKSTKTVAVQTEKQAKTLSSDKTNQYSRGVGEKYSINVNSGTTDFMTCNTKTSSGNCDLRGNLNKETDVSSVEIKTNSVTNTKQNNNKTDIQTVTPKRKKLLILSDDIGRNLNKSLSNKLKHQNYYIESIIKPGATFQQVVENIDAVTRSYTSQDHIIILAGSNNFNKTKQYPLFKNIWDVIKKCRNLNITIATVPYNKNYKVNKFINKFNNKLTDFIRKIDNYVPGKISLLNVGNVSSNTLNRNFICNEIIKIISCKNYIKNLTFVNISNSLNFDNNLDHVNVYNIDDSSNDAAYNTLRNKSHVDELNIDVRPSTCETINIDDSLILTPLSSLEVDNNPNINLNDRQNENSDGFLYPRLSQLTPM